MFHPDHVLDTLYRRECTEAWAVQDIAVMSGSDFCNEILGCFTDLMKSIDPTNPSAVVRRRILRTFHRCWGVLRSSATCFFCLNREPEHILSCRHAMCDNCVVVFGCRSPTVGHHLDVTRCPLCDAEVHLAVRQLPSTKGPNILSLDGGGVRGIRFASVAGGAVGRRSSDGILRPMRRHQCGYVRCEKLP